MAQSGKCKFKLNRHLVFSACDTTWPTFLSFSFLAKFLSGCRLMSFCDSSGKKKLHVQVLPPDVFCHSVSKQVATCEVSEMTRPRQVHANDTSNDSVV